MTTLERRRRKFFFRQWTKTWFNGRRPDLAAEDLIQQLIFSNNGRRPDVTVEDLI